MRRINNRAIRLVAAALCFIMLTVEYSACAATATITKGNRYYEQNGSSRVRITEFEVNGRPAFCVEHGKTAPTTGTEASAEVYKDRDLDKIMYYGFSGPKEWDGFASEKEARSVTSALISYAHYKHAPFDWMEGYTEFMEYLETAEEPDVSLKLSCDKLAGTFDKNWEYQKTPIVEVTGSRNGELTLELPEGIILVDASSGTEATGRARLVSGDRFYLMTKGDTISSLATTISGCNRRVEVTRYVTRSTNVQDLVQLNLVEDKEHPVKIEIEWAKPRSVDLIIHKKGASYSFMNGHIERTEDRLPGAVFEIKGNNTSVKVTTDERGEASVTGLKPGSYTVKELEAPSGYIIDEEIHRLELNIEADKTHMDYNLNLVNEKQTGRITIIKCDNVTGDKLEGAAFTVTDDDGRSVEIRTDASGCACLNKVPLGHYRVEELEAPSGYRLDSKPQEVDLSDESSGSRIKTLTFFDTPDRQAPPETGDADRMLGYVLAAAGCLLAVIMLTVLRRCGKL